MQKSKTRNEQREKEIFNNVICPVFTLSAMSAALTLKT